MTTAIASSFEAHRSLLFGIAYRMLGSAAEAEDILQEAYLRFSAASREDVRSERALLQTIVTRLCLDQLKSARLQRETYPGPWLPEPVYTDEGADAETISLAFLVLLESLSPTERAAYLLYEVFDYSHSEVAGILGKEEAACRQLVHRARGHLLTRRPRFAPSKEAHARMLDGFLEACAHGDIDGLARLLAEDVVSFADSGGKVRGASRKPVQGRHAVARLFIGLARRLGPDVVLDIIEVNGWPALLVRSQGAPLNLLTIETDGQQVHAIRSIVNPDKLEHLDAALRLAKA